MPMPPAPESETVDARLRLLDRQVHDSDDVPVMVVDDLELSGLPRADGVVDPGTPPISRPRRISWKHVRTVGTALTLDVRSEDLDASWAERWVRDRIIRHIPGAQHDPY
jgi:hypothetical protein